MRPKLNILALGLLLTILNPINASAIGDYDGVWIGPLNISFSIFNETLNAGTIIYQESANVLHQFDQVFGKVEMVKSGNQWVITSPLDINYAGINFIVSTFTLTFLSDSHFTSSINFTADGIPGNGSIDAYKQTCQILKNNSTLTGLNGAVDSVKCYEINLPSGTTDLDLQTMGGTGDADLALAYHRPLTEWENYFSENLDNNEQIFVPKPKDGKWYIVIVGFEAYSGMSLNIIYQAIKAMPWVPLLLLYK